MKAAFSPFFGLCTEFGYYQLVGQHGAKYASEQKSTLAMPCCRKLTSGKKILVQSLLLPNVRTSLCRRPAIWHIAGDPLVSKRANAPLRSPAVAQQDPAAVQRRRFYLAFPTFAEATTTANSLSQDISLCTQ